MDYFREFNTRKPLLGFIYISYLWIPMRLKLENDHKREKFILISEQTRAQNEKPEVVKSIKVENGPKIIDQWLPKINCWGNFYYSLSTMMHTLNLVTLSIIFYLGGELVGKNTRIQEQKFPLICYAPRGTIHKSIDQSLVDYANYAASIFHLIWRFLLLYVEREIRLDPIIFLLINDKRIDNSKDIGRALKIYRHYGALELSHEITMFKIEDKLHDKVEFRLRPNRSQEARAELIKIVEFVAKLSTLIVASIIMFLLPLFIYTLLFETQAAFVGCNIEPFTLIHLYKIITTSIMSIIVAIDSFAALAYPLMVGYILVVDSMLYWSHIKSILMNHLYRMRKLRILSDTYKRPDALLDLPRSQARCHHHYPIQTTPLQTARIGFSPYGHCYHDSNTTTTTIATREQETPSLEKLSHEIESIVCDFFTQLRHADQYVSLLLAYTFCVWLACNFVASILMLQSETTEFTSIIIRCIQVFGFCFFSLITSFVLGLKRSTEPDYRTINSLMAQDPTFNKKRWVLLLKYYTGRPRHAFTILHSKVFTFGLFLKIFSYTFTFGLYLQSFRSNAQMHQIMAHT